jgi:hypothetical protein
VDNLEHRRAFLPDQQLAFSIVPPYRATLPNAAINDQNLPGVNLFKLNSDSVPKDKWAFRETTAGSGTFDQVEITITEFDVNATYFISYQSTDRTVLDELGFDELRTMITVGDTAGQNKYIEFTDYRIVTDIIGNTPSDPDALIAGSANANLTGEVLNFAETASGGASTGTIALGSANSYTYPYNLHYKLECTSAPSATESVWEVTITHLTGGNAIDAPVPAHSSLTLPTVKIDDTVNDTNFNLAANTPFVAGRSPTYDFTDGIRLTFTYGTGFDVGDIYEWDGMAPNLIEIASHHDNTNQFSDLTEPLIEGNTTPGTSPTSGGFVDVHPDTDYSGEFDRAYHLECTAITPATTPGTTLDRTATFVIAGYQELPITEATFTVDESVAASLKVEIEDDIFLRFDFGGGHSAVDPDHPIAAADATDLGTAITLATEMRSEYNDHDGDVGAGAPYHFGGSASHPIAAAAPTDLATLVTFCQEAQTDYTAHIADTTMHFPADAVFTLDPTITPTDLSSCILFLNDWKAKLTRHYDVINFTVGDTWTTTALAARQDFTAKDDRLYTLTTTSVVAGTSVTFSFYTDTFEGSFGSNFSVTPTDPYLRFTDNIVLSVRNFEGGPSGDERFAANDIFTFNTLNEDLVDWSLVLRETETFANEDIKQDVLGNITGVPLSYYVTLEFTPSTVLRVRDPSTGSLISYSLVQAGGENTPFISFATLPSGDVEVKYEHRGEEPDPGNIYFITAHQLRPAALYNTPIKFLLRDDMDRGLSPKTSDNHVWLMGDLAFDTGFFGAFFVQVLDQSGTQDFSAADFRLAIDSTETNSEITDVTVLSRFDVLGYSKTSVVNMNDPFEAKERALWVGVPIGTPIGDVDTADTLVFLARKTLQLSGLNPARGQIRLCANQRALRTFTLEDGSSSQVELDGSFLAGYTAAYNASFVDPSETLLNKDSGSFDEMDTFNESEVQILGGASIYWFDDVGAGIFRFGESHTVDTTSPETNEISAINQKDDVVRRVRRDMTDALIGVVPPSTTAGVTIITSTLVSILSNLVTRGIIAPYGQEENPPVVRKINPNKDVVIFVDEQDKRLYNFQFFFNVKQPIKRLFGLFSLNSRFWDNRSNSASI